MVHFRKTFLNFSQLYQNKQIIILSCIAFAFAEPKPGIVSSQTVTTTQHHAPLVAAAPVVAAAPAITYASPYLASPYVGSPYVASPYYHSSYVASPYAGVWPGYYGAAYTAPVVSHAAPVVSAGYTVPSVYGYALNSPYYSPYQNYLLLKKKK